MSDWEMSDAEEVVAVVAAKPVVPVSKSKWEGEDDDGKEVVSDWEASSDDEKKTATTKPVLAPAKKKGTLKAKLAQKEAERTAKIENGELSDEDEIEMHPQERERINRERQLQADLKNAEDLLGAAALKASSGSHELDQLLKFDPKTKEDFQQLSSLIIQHVLKQHETKPLYSSFLEHHVRELCLPLKDLEVRKAASALTTLANEKQKEQRDKSSGKRKAKAGAKTAGPAKVAGKVDTTAYVEALDDFGNDPNDFM